MLDKNLEYYHLKEKLLLNKNKDKLDDQIKEKFGEFKYYYFRIICKATRKKQNFRSSMILSQPNLNIQSRRIFK